MTNTTYTAQGWAAISSALAAGFTATVEAAPRRLQALAQRCNEAGPLVQFGALDMPEPGFDVLVEAARWGRAPVLDAAGWAGADLGVEWTDAVTLETVNLLGVVLAGYVSLVELGLMGAAMEADYVEAVAMVVEHTGVGLARCPVPIPGCAGLVERVQAVYGFSVVGWC